MKKYFLFVAATSIIWINAIAQVNQFPQVYYSAQGTSSGQKIRTTPSLTGNSVISVMTSKIGAETFSSVTLTPYGVQNWIKVCLPSTTGNIYYGYMLCNEFYARINEVNNYATVTATSLNIRPCAGCTTTNVTIGEKNSMFGLNSILALTGNTSGSWYEVYLPTNCSQATGWVSGSYLTVNSEPSNYRNVGGRICSDASSCSYLGDLGGAVVTFGTLGATYSSGEGGGNSGGYYEYKLPTNASINITCTHPNYSISTPTSYAYKASNHNYTRNFLMGNTTSTYTISGTITNSTTNAAISGVTVNATDLSATTTNSSGYYSFSVSSGYSGTVTPAFSGFTFSPPNLPISNVTSNQTSQNFSGTGKAYTISGTITNSTTNAAISGVTVNATDLNATTTNSSGYYSFSISSGYSGIVTPAFSGFTFSPPNRAISNVTSNQTSQNFSGTPSSSIAITSFIIPPWQREGDEFHGSVSASTSSPSGDPWHLEIDVFDAGGNYLSAIIYPTTTASTQNFYSTDPQLAANSLNERKFVFFAVLNANKTTAQAGSMKITEKKWTNKNVVLFNQSGQQLKIPLKNIPGATKVTVFFCRNKTLSSSHEQIEATQYYNQSTFPLFPNCTYCSSSNPPIYPQFCHTIDPESGYFVLDVGLTNNLVDLPAGVFDYAIGYYTNSLTNSALLCENGTFDLSKIGNVNNSNTANNNIVVLVGGNIDIESSIKELPNQSTAFSIHGWSISNIISKDYSKNTWYISTSNLNPLQKNAFNLGIALEEIRKQCISTGANSPNISVIAHSKGGLEMRIMMDSKGAPNSSPSNFITTPLSPFLNVSINNCLHSVIFIGTPHHGVETGYFRALEAPFSYINNEINAPQILNYFQNGTSVPNNIRVANVAAYRKCNISDGAVDLSSGDNINIYGAASIKKFYVKSVPIDNSIEELVLFSIFCESGGCSTLAFPGLMLGCEAACYGNTILDFVSLLMTPTVWNNSFHHNYLTSSYVLNNQQLTCLADNTLSSVGIINKIMSVINNTPVNNCVSPSTQNCRPIWIQLLGSVIQNATISKKNL